MFVYTLFRFKSRKIPTDFSDKLHPRMNTGAFPKHRLHLVHLRKFFFIVEFILSQKFLSRSFARAKEHSTYEKSSVILFPFKFLWKERKISERFFLMLT